MSGPAIWDQTHLIPLFVLSAVENRGLGQVMFLTKTGELEAWRVVM